MSALTLYRYGDNKYPIIPNKCARALK